ESSDVRRESPPETLGQVIILISCRSRKKYRGLESKPEGAIFRRRSMPQRNDSSPHDTGASMANWREWNIQRRKHGHQGTYKRHHTGSLRTPEGSLPDLWQTRTPQTEIAAAQGPHRRLQDHRLSRDYLWRVSGPVRLLHRLPHDPRGRPPQGPLR